MKPRRRIAAASVLDRIVLLICLALPGPAAVAATEEPLTVAVAANMSYAFDDLADAFRKQTGIVARGTTGASGTLAAQILSGAPYDILLSADMDYPQALYTAGAAVTAPKPYAVGLLVLWTRNGVDLGRSFQALSDPAVKTVAIANPRLAPYGREAMHALEHFGLRATVEPKLIYGENVSQVSQYIDTGSVDAGFTAKSIVVAPRVKGRGAWIEVPRGSYAPIAQGVVILKHGAATQAGPARKFVAFLFSPAARAILDKYGYAPP